MRTETIDPEPNCFPADNHATFGKQILDISRAQRGTDGKPRPRNPSKITGLNRAALSERFGCVGLRAQRCLVWAQCSLITVRGQRLR